MPGRAWIKSELLQVLELYCLIPFGRIHRHNPEIQRLARELERTPSAVALKMTNFASLDPTIGQRGMVNSSNLDRNVWTEFFENMMASLVEGPADTQYSGFGEQSRVFEFEKRGGKHGLDVRRLLKTRLNQDFFRRLTLASYENRCALTNIDAPELLIASHIVPWSQEASIRVAPENGICLNALHDRAFDQGFMSFADDYSVLYSSALPESSRRTLESFGTEKLRLPSKFVPDLSLLARHRQTVFRGT